MKFILDPNNDSFGGRHFKFLGRWIHYYLKEDEIKEKIMAGLRGDIETVEKSRLSGLPKLWLYQFYILSRISWHLLSADLDLSFAKELQMVAQPYLKRWAGISRSVDAGVLY